MSVNPDDIVYTWKIHFFNCYPTLDNFQDVIFQIAADYIGTYNQITSNPDEGKPTIKEYKYSRFINASVNTDNISEFTPFDQITYDMTVSWILSDPSVNIQELQSNLYEMINNTVYPPPPTVVTLPPPF